MTVYFITIGLVAVIALLDIKFANMESVTVDGSKLLGRKKPTNIAVFSVFLILAFVAAFRYSVGSDFFAYYNANHYDYWIKFNGFTDEVGFSVLAWIAKNVLGDRDGALTVLSAILTVGLFVFTIAKRSDNFFVSILLFFFICFTGLFNGVRQYIAAGVLFAGYPFVRERKLIPWAIVTLLAASFHITAILMFFIYFICNCKCDWKLVLVYFIGAVILQYLYEPLFDLVGALKHEDLNMNDEYLNSSVNILRVIVQCVPLVLFVFIDKKKINDDSKSRVLFNVCILNSAIAIAAINSAYFSRFYIYTSCFQILMYPCLFNKMKREDKIIFTMLLILFYFLFCFYEIYNSKSLNHFQWIFNL